MPERPPSPLPQFLAYLARVLEERDPPGWAVPHECRLGYNLGRCREALCHRMNRLERPEPVLLSLYDHCAGSTGSRCPLVPDVAVAAMLAVIDQELARRSIAA